MEDDWFSGDVGCGLDGHHGGGVTFRDDVTSGSGGQLYCCGLLPASSWPWLGVLAGSFVLWI